MIIGKIIFYLIIGSVIWNISGKCIRTGTQMRNAMRLFAAVIIVFLLRIL